MALEQKKKADTLKKEMAWSLVVAKEKELTEKIEESAKVDGRISKIRESLKAAEVRMNIHFVPLIDLYSTGELYCHQRRGNIIGTEVCRRR
jgi:hypothetical protein